MTAPIATLRPKRPSDEAAIYEVWEKSVRATHSFLSAKDFHEISTLVRRDYVPNAALEVALVADCIVGFIGMTDLHIDALFIAPDWLGKGIGRQFIAYARNKRHPITVDVNEQNVDALRFYRRQGFSVTRRTPVDSDGRPYPILYLSEAVRA